MSQKIRELLRPTGFFAALWPYRYSCVIFSHCNAESRKLRAAYTIAVSSTYLTIAYLSTDNVFQYHGEEIVTNLPIVVDQMISLVHFNALLIHVLIWYLVGHARYTEVVSSLTALDRELGQVCSGQLNLRTMVIRQLICLTVSVGLFGILLASFGRSDPMSILNMTSSIYPGLVTNVVVSFFGNLVVSIGERYALINRTLELIAKRLQGGPVHSQGVAFDEIKLIQQLRVVHNKLFFISRNIMDAFGFQMLVCVPANFMFTVNALYTLFRSQTSPCEKTDTNGIFTSIVASAYGFAVVVYAAYCCHQTVAQATETTKILNSLTANCEDLHLEVSSFSHQLIHYQLHFSPLGFFQLDLALVQSLGGSIATYLVILVQLSPAPVELTCAKNITSS